MTPDDKASSDNTFTPTDLEREAPDVDPSDAQQVELAQKNGQSVTGMTFSQPAADGTATDVLIFTFRGKSLRIKCRHKRRPLFEAMMDTWSFQ